MILKGSPKGNSRGLGLKNKEERIPFFKSTQSALVSVEVITAGKNMFRQTLKIKSEAKALFHSSKTNITSGKGMIILRVMDS